MKKVNSKVSIIIPVYNGSNYLKEAIDSALAQTYKNIEIIVVNDGSTDDGATEKIAKSYGDRIRYFSKENGGVATALNLGIEKMTGEYFSWLSHDDKYFPYKIKRQINYLNKLHDKKVVLYSNYILVEGDKKTSIVHDHRILMEKPKYSLLRGCVNGITLLIPKIILNETGKFDEKLKCTQDYEYWARIQQKYEFVHMKDMLSMTRVHANQDSKVSPNMITEADKLWINLVEAVSKNEKISYEGSVHDYYSEMVNFLKETPYSGALKYCSHQMAESKPENKAVSRNPIKKRAGVLSKLANRFRNQNLPGISRSVFYRFDRTIKQMSKK